jgi:hypothetical protein
MTNIDNKLRILAAKARGEIHPHVDVTDSVIAILTAKKYRNAHIPERPLMWMAAVSSVAAVFTVIFAIVLHLMWTDPLMEISQAISWVTQ